MKTLGRGQSRKLVYLLDKEGNRIKGVQAVNYGEVTKKVSGSNYQGLFVQISQPQFPISGHKNAFHLLVQRWQLSHGVLSPVFRTKRKVRASFLALIYFSAAYNSKQHAKAAHFGVTYSELLRYSISIFRVPRLNDCHKLEMPLLKMFSI